jgi:dipeptidyl aminopeptidase/acylaminoacyl peptidase
MEKSEDRESVVLKNDGQKIFGIMHRPLLPEPYPVVLVCHGLGGHKTGKYRLYVNLAEMLTRLGIGCLRIDFRGSGDSEGCFSEMTIETELSDALLALNFLKQDTLVDVSRIGVFGRSFGGVIAVMAASQFGDIRSMALWAPVFNGDQWRDKWALLKADQLSEEHRDKLMRINGQLPSQHFYEQLFGLNVEVQLKSLNHLPLLHIHGEMDEIVNLSHAEGYQALRRQASGNTRFLRLGNSDHDFSHPIEQKTALNETVQWFKQTL